jgi:murein DD-endopeptidase MepM/ murein hydrolase activator NlpD
MHLEKANSGLLPCLSPDLTVGSSFKRGQLLGIADNSGGSTGAHLHFQLHTVPKTDNWNSWLFGDNEQKNLSQIDPTNWIYIKGRNT